ncbi:hypothetical protein ABZS81_09435 [Streptomyces sp. NPDC005318]|uniref:hypothetical protein n=1 Tax=Streptomyces sp. NPDC005318 TaxID=3157031 RepID=UPI0033B6696F
MRDETQRTTDMPVPPEVAALLTAAQRVDETGPMAEERALDAFRTARDEGAHAPVPPLLRRRRDDWRPVERRRGARSLRSMAAGFAAAAMLGGVAVAAGSGAVPTPFGDRRPHPTHSTNVEPDSPGSRPRETQTPSADGTQHGVTDAAGTGPAAGHPGRAQDDTGLCRAYRLVQGRGKAQDASAFDRLSATAGGASAVPGYCDGLLGPRTAQEKQGTGKGRRPEPGSGGPEPTPSGPKPAKESRSDTPDDSGAR